MSLLLPAATPGWGMVTPLSAHFPNCRADQMPSALPHSAAKGPYAAVSPAISPVAARPAYPHCRRQRCSAGGWRRPLSTHPPNCRADHTLSVLPHSAAGVHTPRYRPLYHLRRPTPLIPTSADSDASYPRIPPTTPGASHTLQTERVCPPAVHRPMRPYSAGKRRIDLHVGGEERGAANKSRIAAEKEAGLIPQAVRLPKERHLPRATKGGAPVPRPALRRSVQNPLPFPALMQNRRGCRPTPNHLPLPSSWAASPLPPSGHGALPCPQWSAPFCRATRLPATEIMDKPGRE